MASVKVNMKLCGKTHVITVTQDDKGDLNVQISTDCDHVKQYAERIPTVTMDDVTDMSGSKVTSYENTMMMTPTCLVPKGVLYAAWLEIGMISETRAKEVGGNSVSFIVD